MFSSVDATLLLARDSTSLYCPNDEDDQARSGIWNRTCNKAEWMNSAPKLSMQPPVLSPTITVRFQCINFTAHTHISKNETKQSLSELRLLYMTVKWHQYYIPCDNADCTINMVTSNVAIHCLAKLQCCTNCSLTNKSIINSCEITSHLWSIKYYY